MKIEVTRAGKLIESMTWVDKTPLYAGSILVHELVVLAPLYAGEALAVSFATNTGEPITYTKMLKRREREGMTEYYTGFPTAVMRAGNRVISVFILDLYEPNDSAAGYRCITTADMPFQVYPTSANTDFEPVDESVSLELQRKMDNLIQPPDCTEANEVSTPENPAVVEIGEQGNLVFKNLRGHDGTDMRYLGDWAAGMEYRSDDDRIDSATYAGGTYTAVKTHIADESNKPPNAAYWNLSAAKGGIGDKGEDSMWLTGFMVSETDGHLYGLSTRELDSLPYRIDPYTGHLMLGIQRKENNA